MIYYKLSNQREIYKDGFIVDETDAGNGSISLDKWNYTFRWRNHRAE